MRIYYDDNTEFRPWAGGVETMHKLEALGMIGSFWDFVESWFDGCEMSEAEFNDFLWFEADDIARQLDILPSDWDNA